MRTNSFRQISSLKHGGAFRGVFSPDRSIIATSGMDRYIRFWDVSTLPHPQELPPAIEEDGWIWALAFSPDGKFLAAGSDDRIPFWDTQLHILGTSVANSPGMVNDVVFSRNGRKVAAADANLNISVWDRNQPGDRLTLQGHEAEIFSLSFSKDGNTLASGARDGTVKLWDVSGFEPKGITWPFRDFIGQVAFSPNGKFLAGACTGDRDQVKLWDRDGNRHRELQITGLAFSEDGHLLASTGLDGRVGLWDARDGRNIALFNAHAGEAWSVAFSPEGKTLLSSGDDSTIKFWNLATLQQAGSLQAHRGAIATIAFSPKGDHLATGGNRKVRIWDAPAFEEIDQKKKARK